MQDDGFYHSSDGYVYTDDLALEISAIWDGVDVLEQRGVLLGQIARALTTDWKSCVVMLAILGRRP